MTVEQLEEVLQDGSNLESVLNAFLPYFKKKKESIPDMTLATANEIHLETKAQVDFDFEEPVSWSTNEKILEAFETFLSNYQGSFDAQIHLLFPMLCQPLDDYRSKNRLSGVRCAKHFLSHTSPALIHRFRIQHVLYESFKTSVSFDNAQLQKESLMLWLQVIGMIEEFGSKDFLAQCDQILLLACREVELGRTEERRQIFLECLEGLIPLMSHFAIRYLRKLVATLGEVRKDTNLLQVETVMRVVIQYCWPRIDSSLKATILESFPSLKSDLSFVE